MEPLRGRQNYIQWDSAAPFSDILWLADVLQQTALQLTCRYNVAKVASFDTPGVMAALFVVQA
jgi:hypothetical protein